MKLYLKIGRRFRHKQFGDGEIIGFSRSYKQRQYSAIFRTATGEWFTAWVAIADIMDTTHRQRPASDEEALAMRSLGLTLRQVRNARR